MKIIYRVSVDISQSVTPTYGEWLSEHVQDMLELTTEDGTPLFDEADIDSVLPEDGSSSHTVEYATTKEKLAYYEQTHADKMRSAFKEVYPDTSIFNFSREIIPM